jgi:hypothetical protein
MSGHFHEPVQTVSGSGGEDYTPAHAEDLTSIVLSFSLELITLLPELYLSLY